MQSVGGSYSEAEDVWQLPRWLLEVLGPEEQAGLLRLSILPLAITMEMATCVLPPTCKHPRLFLHQTLVPIIPERHQNHTL